MREWTNWGNGYQLQVKETVWYVGDRWSGRPRGEIHAIRFRRGKVVQEAGPFDSHRAAMDAVDRISRPRSVLKLLLEEREKLNKEIREVRKAISSP